MHLPAAVRQVIGCNCKRHGCRPLIEDTRNMVSAENIILDVASQVNSLPAHNWETTLYISGRHLYQGLIHVYKYLAVDRWFQSIILLKLHDIVRHCLSAFNQYCQQNVATTTAHAQTQAPLLPVYKQIASLMIKLLSFIAQYVTPTSIIFSQSYTAT